MTATTTSLENTRASRTQWLITLYAGGGEFCDGYILSIIGVALPLLTVSFSLSAVAAGLLGAASLVGMFFGGLIFGAVTDKFGRQKVTSPTWRVSSFCRRCSSSPASLGN
jgi:putative MFS transporter